MRQVEMSRTLVFDDPRRARAFFEALVADNIGIGRPDEVHAVFGRRPRGRTDRTAVPTRVVLPGHRRQDGLPLQALPGQAVPERREGVSYRDRHQQARPTSGSCARLEHLPEVDRQGPRRSTLACL